MIIDMKIENYLISTADLLLEELHEVGAGIGSLVLWTAQVTTGAEHQPD